MAEWLYEEGIGENRAVLVDDERILEAVIELPGGVRAGSILAGRLTAILMPRRRGIVTLGNGAEVLVEPLPAALTEGAVLETNFALEAEINGRWPWQEGAARERRRDAPDGTSGDRAGGAA